MIFFCSFVDMFQIEIDGGKVMSPGKRSVDSPDTQAKRQKLANGDFVATETPVEQTQEIDGAKSETIPQLFSTLSAFLPEWVWISWITDMLSALDRPQGKIYKVIDILNVSHFSLEYSLKSDFEIPSSYLL